MNYEDYLINEGAHMDPCRIHIANTQMAFYFRRYLIQKAMAVFEWSFPESWNHAYTLYNLYIMGRVAVIDAGPEFGIVPQYCTLSGRGLYMQPTRVLIANPVLPDITRELTIGVDCGLLKLAPDYGGIYDMACYYGNIMAEIAEAAGTNLINSKLAYLFAVENPTAAASFKKLYDQIASGMPAAWYDKNLMNEDGTPAWQTFAQNLKQNYITTDLLNDLRAVENDFCTHVGIPNANITKRERLVTDEVNANNIETATLAEGWLDTIRKSIDETVDVFPELEGRISVRWRHDPFTSEEVDNETAEYDAGRPAGI